MSRFFRRRPRTARLLSSIIVIIKLKTSRRVLVILMIPLVRLRRPVAAPVVTLLTLTRSVRVILIGLIRRRLMVVRDNPSSQRKLLKNLIRPKSRMRLVLLKRGRKPLRWEISNFLLLRLNSLALSLRVVREMKFIVPLPVLTVKNVLNERGDCVRLIPLVLVITVRRNLLLFLVLLITLEKLVLNSRLLPWVPVFNQFKSLMNILTFRSKSAKKLTFWSKPVSRPAGDGVKSVVQFILKAGRGV